MQIVLLRRPLIYLLTFVVTILALIVFLTLRSQASRADDIPPAQTRSQPEQQAREQRLRELDAKLKDPGVLLLRAAEFDPLKTPPPALRLGAAQLEMVQPAKTQIEAQASDVTYFTRLVLESQLIEIKKGRWSRCSKVRAERPKELITA